MNYEIRSAVESDAESMVALLNPIIEAGTFTSLEGPLSVDEQLAFIRSMPERSVFHVAVSETRLLGMQDVIAVPDADCESGCVGEISTFVALDAHRRGIGRRLFEATIARVRALGISRVRATVRRSNPGAIDFYKALGFRPTGEQLQPATGEQTVMELSVAASR